MNSIPDYKTLKSLLNTIEGLDIQSVEEIKILIKKILIAFHNEKA